MQARVSRATGERDGHFGAGRSVGPGIGEEVSDRLLEAVGVAHESGWFLGEVQEPVVARAGGAGVVGRVQDEMGQVDRFVFEGPSGVEAREEQQASTRRVMRSDSLPIRSRAWRTLAGTGPWWRGASSA